MTATVLGRRAALFLAATGALAACAGQTPAQVSAVAVADLNTGIAGLSKALPQLGSDFPSLLPASLETALAADLADAASVMTSVSTSMAATAAATPLQKAEGDLNAVLTALAAVPAIPQPYSVIIAAAATLLPGIEAYVSTLTGNVGASSASAAKLAAAHPMTRDEARLVLRGAANSKN